MSNINTETMNPNEQEFEQQVRAHKATIYTVCYMFSKDQDEVADTRQARTSKRTCQNTLRVLPKQK